MVKMELDLQNQQMALHSAPIYVYQATNFGIRTTSLPGKGIRCNSFPSMAVDRSGGPNNVISTSLGLGV
jgi:hypothetical protein